MLGNPRTPSLNAKIEELALDARLEDDFACPSENPY
jgi:hypothetical protein